MAKNSSKYIKQINKIAQDYSRDISWLAGIHVALKSNPADVIQVANALLVHPEKHLIIKNLPPDQARIEFENEVALFKKLCSFASSSKYIS